MKKTLLTLALLSFPSQVKSEEYFTNSNGFVVRDNSYEFRYNGSVVRDHVDEYCSLNLFKRNNLTNSVQMVVFYDFGCNMGVDQISTNVEASDDRFTYYNRGEGHRGIFNLANNAMRKYYRLINFRNRRRDFMARNRRNRLENFLRDELVR